MKRNTLFEHKEFAITCEEIMVDVEEYRKLLKPRKKLEKTPNNTQIEKMCSFCHKPGNLKKRCDWNLNNPNKNLKDKKQFGEQSFSSSRERNKWKPQKTWEVKSRKFPNLLLLHVQFIATHNQ
jgi:hypothetical protein